ncbi:MAG: MFS transporter [Symbiobacteriia bacterium]
MKQITLEQARAEIKGSPAQALVVATIGFFGGFLAVALFGPLAPKFAKLMALTPMQAGILAAVTNLSGSLLRIPFGAAVDRYGGKVPHLMLMILSLVGLPGLIYVVNAYYPGHMTPSLYPWLLVLGVFIGAGIATFSVGIAQVSYWFPKKGVGGANAIYGGLGNLAPGASSFLLPVAAEAWGLPAAYTAWMLALLAITVIYGVFMHDAPVFQLRRKGIELKAEEWQALGQEALPSSDAWGSLKASASRPATWGLVALYFTSFGGFLALSAWFPSFWSGFFGTTTKLGGLLTLTYATVTSLSRVPGGSLADRFGAYRVINIALGLMATGAGLIAVANSVAVALAGAILMAVGMGVQNAAVFKLVPSFGAGAVGGTSGWVGGLGAFGGFALPVLMGLIAGGSLGFRGGFLIFLPLAAISLLLVWWLGQSERAGSRPLTLHASQSSSQ